MKRHLLFFLCAIIFQQSHAQTNQDSIWFVTHYKKIEKMVPMRDGINLFTAIYYPTDSTEKHPFLLNRTPYSCAPYGEKNIRKFWLTYQMAYAHEGYIFVFQDVRGRFMSEGVFEDIRPFNSNKKGKEIDEASDTYDAIDWLVKNIPNNNGNAGVSGISYPGFYSTMAALSGHPALKAVSPQAPVTDWFMGDDFHHNGVFMRMDAFEFYKNFGVPRPLPVAKYNDGYVRKAVDAYKFYLAAGPDLTFTHEYLGDSIGFWNELMQHPNYDAWWKARNPRNFVKNIKPAMLVVGGTFDAEDCFGAWNLYKAIEKMNPQTSYNKIVMGPWFHGAWGGRSNGDSLGRVKFGSKTSVYFQQQIEFPFFQYYLKGKGNIDNIKESNIFFSGENNWKQFAKWPSDDVKYKPFYLQENKGLSFNTPTNASSFSEYVSDPANPVPHEGSDTIKSRTREYMTADQRFAAKRKDVLTFSTGVLDKNITLGGPLVADLMVAITGTDADFIVKLIDVFPDDIASTDTLYANNPNMNGYQMLVRGETMRGRFRNSFEKPEAFTPNKTTEVKFTLPDIAHTFMKGHKIMVQIQSSWFPLTDMNPQTFVDIYHAKASDFQKETIKVFHEKGNASKLVLPVLE